MGKNARDIIRAAERVVGDVLTELANAAVRFANRMAKVLIALLDGLTLAIETHDKEIGRAGRGLIVAIIDGMIEAIGLSWLKDRLWDVGSGMVKEIYEGAKDWAWINSPSRKFMEIGDSIGEGLALGVDKNNDGAHSGANMVERTYSAMQRSIDQMALEVQELDQFNPTITPILDLTNVKATAGQLSGILATNPLQTTASLQAANTLSTETAESRDASSVENQQPSVTEVKFEQHNYSPTQLSTATIYRQTRNQIELAKKELEVV